MVHPIVRHALCLAVAGMTLPALAQDYSADADLAFWCSAAYAHMVGQDLFLSQTQQQQALTDLMRFEGPLQEEGTRLGWTDGQVETWAQTYADEVAGQFADFGQSKDLAALRFNPATCFPSAASQ
jgi:hypothetical protein